MEDMYLRAVVGSGLTSGSDPVKGHSMIGKLFGSMYNTKSVKAPLTISKVRAARLISA